MTHRLPAACAATLCAVLLTAALPALSSDITETPEAWIEDIDYMVERLTIMHPDVYAYNAPGEFDAAVADLKRRVPDATDTEIVMGLHEIVALVRDAHTSVVPWKMGGCALTDDWRAHPLSFHRFRDGWYVLAAAERYRDLVGCRVLRFGEVSPQQALKRASRLVGADNAQGRLVMGSVYMSCGDVLRYCGIAPDRDRLTLRLARPDGREFERTIEAGSLGEMLEALHFMGNPTDGKAVMNDGADAPLPLYLSRPGDAYWFEYLPEHEAMYVHLLSMEPKADEDFEAFYARMFGELDARDAKTLILDVRNNGGGDHYETPLLKGVIARPHLDDREHLFILVGRRVVSASQHFVTQFQLYTDATFVGEPTSSRPNFFGAQRFFELPNSKLQMRSSVIFHQDASGWEMDGTTHPDYLVEPSGADFAANRDPVLELVLDFDRYADLPQRCEDAMTEAYLAGDVAAMERAYTSFLREHADGHLDEHALLGDFTWWMFENRRDLTEYGEFLEMYTRRCPDSSGAWYSLGIRRRNAGDPQAALRCLERSIEAYPGNGPAKRERDLLVFDMERGER